MNHELDTIRRTAYNNGFNVPHINKWLVNIADNKKREQKFYLQNTNFILFYIIQAFIEKLKYSLKWLITCLVHKPLLKLKNIICTKTNLIQFENYSEACEILLIRAEIYHLIIARLECLAENLNTEKNEHVADN